MKNGRNAPCPCGSGKKYKKCCLKTNVTPPEVLQYRRLSEVLDKLMPQLIDLGESIFGHEAAEAALSEFFGWPDPEDMPDEETLERMGMLFWPWFVFNWEYEDSVDDEDFWLDGPEDTTIAELFLEHKNPGPNSLEGKLLAAANRHPYSFHEVTEVQPGRSVRIRDLLTGRQLTVQEQHGSKNLQKGDILFGRAVQVDEVGMFLGLCTYVLPPRMKAQAIQMRQVMRRGVGHVSRAMLYEYDLEIREAYLDMDQELHTLPQIQNIDGDTLEPHKLIYEIDSPDLALEKLASLCETATPEEIRAAATTEEDGTVLRASIDWNRAENPIHKGIPNIVLGNIEIDGSRMAVSVNSARRAATIRRLIDQRLGAAARFRLEKISEFDAMAQVMGEEGLPAAEHIEDHPEIKQYVVRMLETYWKEWLGQKLPALGNKTPRQAARTVEGREALEALLLDSEKVAAGDPVRDTIETAIIADVRRRLKLDRPLEEIHNKPDPETMNVRITQVKAHISEFGERRLHDAYTALACRLCDVIAESPLLHLHRGRDEIWAAAIVYAVAQLNFLFAPETPHALSPDELCEGFQVKKTTVSAKAYTIRSTLDILPGDERFCAPHVTEIFSRFEDDLGWMVPPDDVILQSKAGVDPLPLKPSEYRDKAKAQKAQPDETPGKIDGRQLSLFDE